MSEPLVLLPAMGCSGRLWGGVTGALPLERVVHRLVDAATVDACVEDLLETLPPRFALCGAALGGVVAMALVRRAPERVTKLCLVSTNPHPPTEDQLDRWGRQRQHLAQGATGRDLQRDLLPILLYRRTPELEKSVLRMADEVGDEVFERQLSTQMSRVDERPGLSRIEVPTLVIAAAQDQICPVAKHEEIHALVPGSKLMVIDGVGHLAPLEASTEVGAIIVSWLEKSR
jgi:pimeloyl-ACP methyl ester carboxylesterase